MHVIIVGAGIAGLAATWALARRGIRVTLIEQDTVPGRRAASNDHQRLLRHAYPGQEGYARMVRHALDAWSNLWHDLGESFYHQTGSLLLSSRDNDWSDRSRRELARLDIDFDVLSPAMLSERYPMLATGHAREGVLIESGGVLMAQKILLAIGRYCESYDVSVLPGTTVTHVDFDSARVRLESDEELLADRVLVTTGAWGGDLCDAIGQATRSVRQCSLYLDPPPRFTSAWLDAPSVVDFGSDDAIYAAPPIDGADGARLKFGVESHGRVESPDVSRIPEPREAVRLLQTVGRYLTDAEHYEIKDLRVCCYSQSVDQRWVSYVGERGVAIGGCSGHLFKMGSVVGRGLAAWATNSVSGPDLVAWLRGSVTHASLPEQF